MTLALATVDNFVNALRPYHEKWLSIDSSHLAELERQNKILTDFTDSSCSKYTGLLIEVAIKSLLGVSTAVSVRPFDIEFPEFKVEIKSSRNGSRRLYISHGELLHARNYPLPYVLLDTRMKEDFSAFKIVGAYEFSTLPRLTNNDDYWNLDAIWDLNILKFART